MSTISEKAKAVELALAHIERSFGKGSIMRLGESQKIQVETFSTGSISLDMALGGGVPKGRIIEVYGPESSGKTTLTLHMISEVQKAGGMAAFIDAEHALDPDYAKKIGVNLDNLLISQPDSGEQALEIAETLVRSNALDIIVIDSVAALTPKAEIEGEMGDSHMGLQARLMSQALRKLTAAISKSKTTVVFINQLRMKIGVMFGNPETTTGGNALKFYSSVRMEIRSVGKLEEGTGDEKQYTGHRVKVKVVKNKIAPPLKHAEFDILYNTGICRMGDLIDLAASFEIIKKSGAFYSYGDLKIGQGRENVKAFLKTRENEKLVKSIEKDLLEHISKLKAAQSPNQPEEKAAISKASEAKNVEAKATAKK